MEYNLNDIYLIPNNYQDLLFTEGYIIYRIRNIINNKSYIGDTKINLYNRLFTGWNGSHFGCYEIGYKSHLYNSMRKYGLENFKISILPKGPSEEDYIKIYDSYYNGYNQNLTGKGTGDCNLGMIWITDGIKSKLIHSLILDKFLNQGWKLGRTTDWLVGRIWINKNDVLLRVTKDELIYYLELGWKLGTAINTGGNKDYCWVNNGVTEWQIPIENIKDYPELIIGRLTKLTNGLIAINNGTNMKFIDPTRIDELSDDWRVGSISHSNKDYIYINDGKNNKAIPKSELKYWLDKGYYKGRLSSSTTGRVNVVNELGINKVVQYSELKDYKLLGYRLGRKWNNSSEIDVIDHTSD